MYQVRCLSCAHKIQSAKPIPRGQSIRCSNCQEVFLAQFIDEVSEDELVAPTPVVAEEGPKPIIVHAENGPKRIISCAALLLLFVIVMGYMIVRWAAARG
jgi:hypothetical protein